MAASASDVLLVSSLYPEYIINNKQCLLAAENMNIILTFPFFLSNLSINRYDYRMVFPKGLIVSLNT